MIRSIFTCGLVAAWVVLFSVKPLSANKTSEKFPARVDCEGRYPGHLQGICLDDERNIYWCFTTSLVKTDSQGKLLQMISVVSHHGDLCYANGKIYVAVNLGRFNDPKGNADSWVYVYDTQNLEEITRHETPQVKFGAGGMATHQGRFLVVSGLPHEIEENYLYEFDDQFQFVKKHILASGHTHLGIQGATFSENTWWFACYGDQILTATSDLKMRSRHAFECGYGIVGLDDGQYYIARGDQVQDKGHSGYLLLAEPDEKLGLKVLGP